MTGTDLDRDARADITDVLVRYASGVDRRDWARFRTCFTSDCEADYGDIGVWRDLDEITDFMERSHALCGRSLHRITNVSIDAADACGAQARCYVDAVIMGPDNRSGMRVCGFYDDDLVHTDSGWRIARRRYTMVHMEPVGDAVIL